MGGDSSYGWLWRWVLPGVALLVTAVAAFYKLSDSPGIWYDEGYYFQLAVNVVHYGREVIQLAPHEFMSAWSITVGYPLIYPVALSMKLFGIGVLQARVPMALFIIAT